MGFLCPICKSATMVSAALEEGLPTERCTGCGGHWITSARYFGFLATADAHAPVPENVATAPADAPGLKMCPVCLKFMHYYEVGHGLPFGIDKCNTCGGVWLNAGEWESLKAHGFMRQLHAVSSDIWQAEVEKQRRADQEESAMRRRLGDADYAELQRVAAWLRGHGQKVEMFAYLYQRAHTGGDKQ